MNWEQVVGALVFENERISSADVFVLSLFSFCSFLRWGTTYEGLKTFNHALIEFLL